MTQGTAKKRSSRGWLLGAALLCGVAGAAVWSSQLPEGPVEVIWDRDVCAHCQMHVGEPGFAAQLQTEDGTVLNFDDPGCALAYLKSQKPTEHALYFHHHTDARWLKAPQVAFLPHTPTPMGYGWRVTEPNSPGALSLEELKARISQAPVPEPRP